MSSNKVANQNVRVLLIPKNRSHSHIRKISYRKVYYFLCHMSNEKQSIVQVSVKVVPTDRNSVMGTKMVTSRQKSENKNDKEEQANEKNLKQHLSCKYFHYLFRHYLMIQI